MEINMYKPHPALREFVLKISTVRAILPEGVNEVVTPYPPTPFQTLFFYCNHSVSMGRANEYTYTKQPSTLLIGPQYSRVNIQVHRQIKGIRVDFLPGGMYRMLGIPMSDMFDDGYDARDFFGEEMRMINEQLQNTKKVEEGKNIVEQFLLDQVRVLKNLLPIDSALLMMLNNGGKMTIEKTASFSCLGLRQFERKCKERIGMNPKMFARIIRFSNAYRLHESSPKVKWTEIAYKAGYYDQMHMIKDFKLFTGVNPSVIQKQLQSTPLRMQKDIKY